MKARLLLLKDHVRHLGAAYLVLALSMMLVAFVFGWIQSTIATHQQIRFDGEIRNILRQNELAFNHYRSILQGVCGLFAASELVKPEEFREYLATIKVTNDHEGLLDLGFSMRVPSSQKQTHINYMRSHGFTNYSPLYLGNGPDHFPIAYIDDFQHGGMVSSGWDPSDDPGRRNAMQRACDSGEPVATGLTEVHTIDPSRRTAGFILYLPVYSNVVTSGSVHDRRANLVGFVFGSFDAQALWSEVEKSDTTKLVDLQVFDGIDVKNRRPLYPCGLSRQAELLRRSARFTTSESRFGLGREWTFRFTSRPELDRGLESRVPLVALTGGSVISIGLFLIVLIQAHARVQAERMTANLLRSEQSLRESEVKFRGIFDSIQDLYFRVDLDGRLTMLSPSVLSLTGFEPDELLGRPATSLFQETARWIQLTEMLLAKEQVEHHETAVRKKNDESAIVSVTAHLIRNDAGKPLAYEGIARDVTDQRRLETERLRASKLESVGLLAGGIAHDFNNILTSIVGNLALIRLEAPPGAETSASISEVERSALRARDLTQQLLTFAKGGTPIRKTSSLTDLLRDSIRFALRGSNVRSEFESAPDLWPAKVDVGQVSQAMHNLALNAVQAMPEGGVLRVLTSNFTIAAGDPSRSLAPGPYVKVSLSDTGTGIKPEHLPKIFDPYFTTKQQGSGLGLATTYSILKKHEGLITVDSILGHGTTFHLYLPASPDAQIERESVPPQAMAGNGRVLVVDDEAPIRLLLERMLTKLGYETESVADGRDAIVRFEQAISERRPFEAVILDLTIPGGLGGKETIGELLRLNPYAKVIVSSGYSNDPVMADFRRFGFAGMLVKPYQPEELSAVLGYLQDGGAAAKTEARAEAQPAN
jgi:PAS domain S-box-containing protein